MRISNALTIIAMLLRAAVAVAGPEVAAQAELGRQHAAVQFAAGEPDAVKLRLRGPLIHAGVSLQGAAGQCQAIVNRLYPGLCLPTGPGLPVSPD